jgi:hypothetical protein
VDRGFWSAIVQNVRFVHGHLTGVQTVLNVLSVFCTGTVYADIGSVGIIRTRYGRTECTVCTGVRDHGPVPAPARVHAIKECLYKTVQTRVPP